MLSLGRKLADKTSPLRPPQVFIILDLFRHSLELQWRHYHQKPGLKIWDCKELVYIARAPPRRDGNAILRVHRMPEFAGKDRLNSLGRIHRTDMVF
jgi:hypothetical protein